MTDHELLEFAAKAIGLPVIGRAPSGLQIRSEGCVGGYNWNPIFDDGDAFRLAVEAGVLMEEAVYNYCSNEEYAADELGATRLAIVRCVAATGKAMK